MKNFITRTTSGIIFVLVIVGLMMVHEIGMFFLFLSINVLSLIEFYRLSFKIKLFPYMIPGLISGIILYILSYLVASSFLPAKYMFFAILIVPVTALVSLFYKSGTTINSWGSTVFGNLYISIPLSLIPFIAYSTGNYNYELPLSIFILIWIYDTFAYLTGVNIGKRKIFPSVSPNKTWEGAAGGMVFAIAGAIFLQEIFGILRLDQWIIMALIIIFTSTLGDFLESSLKRNAGVKDSGNLMPGHGGALDRFDSFLFSVPFIFVYLYLVII